MKKACFLIDYSDQTVIKRKENRPWEMCAKSRILSIVQNILDLQSDFPMLFLQIEWNALLYPPTDCQLINQEESVTCFLLKNRTIYSRT